MMRLSQDLHSQAKRKSFYYLDSNYADRAVYKAIVGNEGLSRMHFMTLHSEGDPLSWEGGTGRYIYERDDTRMLYPH